MRYLAHTAKLSGPFSYRVDRLITLMQWGHREQAQAFGFPDNRRINRVRYGINRASVDFVKRLAYLEQKHEKEMRLALHQHYEAGRQCGVKLERAEECRLREEIILAQAKHDRPPDLATLGATGTVSAEDAAGGAEKHPLRIVYTAAKGRVVACGHLAYEDGRPVIVRTRPPEPRPRIPRGQTKTVWVTEEGVVVREEMNHLRRIRRLEQQVEKARAENLRLKGVAHAAI